MDFKRVKPYPGMVITENVEFEEGVFDFFGQEGIIIGADNIVIEGNGACLSGGYGKGESLVNGNTEDFGYEKTNSSDNAHVLGFHGIGIYAQERKGVTIKNLKLSGFDLGLNVNNSRGFIIDSCDFSDCFTDPAWGWDDHGFHGGILFEHVNESSILNCKAVNVWDALNMRFCNDNKILNNNFSHTSDTGLKLWNSCRNELCGNDFSYGIRIDPGEVHARDSSCVLIESGSNDNIFKRNDMTHGGDGLFIRVLNGWMSTGNYFEENDCSYANNNAIEAWADGNTYIRNKANYSSYGFWLGGSDNTKLIENEAAYNGTIFKNAPEAFGNAGIAVVNGSGSHIVMEDNYIHDNCGPGVAIRFNKNYPSFHWVIQGNRIENNKNDGKYKGHGIYAKNARWLTFGMNIIEGNEGEPIFLDTNTSDIVFLNDYKSDSEVDAKLIIKPGYIYAGDEVIFDASASAASEQKLGYRWDLGDGTVETGDQLKHSYKNPGFYRMGLTVDNGSKSSLAYQNIYVLPAGNIFATNEEACEWKVSGNSESYIVTKDLVRTVSGQGSICFEAGPGTEHTLIYPASRQLNMQIGTNNVLYLYLRYVTDSDPDWKRSLQSPKITLYADDANYIELTSSKSLMERLFVTDNEAKDNWELISINIDSDNLWEKATKGYGLDDGVINKIRIDYGNINKGISKLWLDALCFSNREEELVNAIDIGLNKYNSNYPRPLYSSSSDHCDLYAPIRGNRKFFGDATPRFATASEGEGFYGVHFGCTREFDRVEAYFYHNLTKTLNARGEALPVEAWLMAGKGGEWYEIPNTRVKPMRGCNVFVFEPVLADGVLLYFNCSSQHVAALYSFSVYNTLNAINSSKVGMNVIINSNRQNQLAVNSFEVKLNKELNGNGTPLGDLTACVFEVGEDGALGKCLFKNTISKDDIVPYEITRISAGLTGLESGKKYALALGQTNLAESRTVGDYYRWIAGKTEFSETFGIYDNGETKPSDYDWGTAFLRVKCNGITADYSNDSEHIGTRFGLKGMEYRYMTFTMPDALCMLTDGIASDETGWIAEGQDSEIYFRFMEDQRISGVNIWIDETEPDKIELLCDETVLASMTEPGIGLVRLKFESICAKSYTLRINCKSGICAVKEIELIKGQE